MILSKKEIKEFTPKLNDPTKDGVFTYGQLLVESHEELRRQLEECWRLSEKRQKLLLDRTKDLQRSQEAFRQRQGQVVRFQCLSLLITEWLKAFCGEKGKDVEKAKRILDHLEGLEVEHDEEA